MCNFAGMKQTLPELIKQDEELRRTLLAQEGGIVKYLAEHLDADGFTLYSTYQNYVLNEYIKANTWNPDAQLMSEEELRLEALGDNNHLKKELHLRWNLEQLPEDTQEDVAESLKNFYDGYMAYAWREYFEHRNPEHSTDLGFYKTLIKQFSGSDGLAYRSMELTLKEHHGIGWTDNDKYTYFCISEYYYFYFDMFRRQGKRAFDRLRRGVEEWLDGKSDEECRELAVDMLEKVKWFSQHIYNDKAGCSSNGTPFPLEDKKWLREMARGLGKKPGAMGFYFSEFVSLLQEVGRIWAARLLKEHHVDLYTLEKETYSFLQPYAAGNDGYDYHYYVDHYYTNDSPNTCCVKNDRKAKELLYALYGKKIEVEEQNDGKPDLPFNDNNRGINNDVNGVPKTVPDEALILTEEAKLCFEEAVKKKWMKKENDKYSWCGVTKNSYGKKGQLAYFLGKVYGANYEKGYNSGVRLPYCLRNYFGFTKSVSDTLKQVYKCNNIQPWRQPIDDFFDEHERKKTQKSEEKGDRVVIV